MDKVEELKQDAADSSLLRFVLPFQIDIPNLRNRIARGTDTLEGFVDALLPMIRDSILSGVRKEVEGGRDGK